MTAAESRWVVASVDDDRAAHLAADLGLPTAVARLLLQRGYGDKDSAERFLRPRLSEMSDPFGLPGMQAAVERVWTAIRSKQKITVHGDYDVDGITATALLVRVLSKLGAVASFFIPSRSDDGYGLAPENLRQCVREHSTELMITVDCGTGAVAAAAAAREAGIDLIVTDHHEPSGPLAEALALVNPKLIDGEDDSKLLAGVGVAFKLCHALVAHGREKGLPGSDLDLRPYLDLVALGTVADIVPLIGENRALVRYGIALMEKTANPGLQALIRHAGAQPPLRTYNLAFQLAPRINAAGRIGSALHALELLLTKDQDRADIIAAELDTENRERQKIEKDVLRQCEEQIAAGYEPERDYVIVAAGTGWHRGVVGIVASRITRKYHRPSLVIGIEDGQAGGSGRSIAGFSLVDALAECAGDLLKFGGHEMAAGFEIPPERIDDLRNHINAAAMTMLAPDDLVPTLHIDAWIDIEDVGQDLYAAQQMLAPFGQDNPAPLWAVSGVGFTNGPRQVGKGHLKASIGKGASECDAIGFNMWGSELPDGPLDAAFRLERNEFRGRVSYQMNLQALRPH